MENTTLKETSNHSTTYSFNAIEKVYTIEELKQDWLFKLLYKFLKHHGLFDTLVAIPPIKPKDKLNKVIGTMHSNNYCLSKMFFKTISCSVPDEVMTSDVAFKYDTLWLQYIKNNLDLIPKEIHKLFEKEFTVPIKWYLEW